jgi:DNA-binding PucR family transcriptional regulator
VIAGYGREYKTYAEIVKSYREALHAVKVKKLFPRETEGIHGYHELGIYRYLLQVKQWEEEQGYKNERVEKLKQYDRENQTSMLETLETFLDAAGKVNVTAQRLHIHINTLSYRLRRIEEIMRVDLENMNQRAALYLELKMAKLSGEQ